MTTTTGKGPAWEIATLFPDQGNWDEWDYLALDTNRLVEFADGHVEVLPMPTELHQDLLLFLLESLLAFVRPRGSGKALMAPVRVRLRPGLVREPDLVFLLAANLSRREKKYWTGADLVMEVVSEDDPERDYVKKRAECAEAGISEYWIVDPQRREVLVLKLSGDRYDVHGTFHTTDSATSALLSGFAVSVDALFSASDAPGA